MRLIALVVLGLGTNCTLFKKDECTPMPAFSSEQLWGNSIVPTSPFCGVVVARTQVPFEYAYVISGPGESIERRFEWTAPVGSALVAHDLGGDNAIDVRFSDESGPLCVTGKNRCSASGPVCRDLKVIKQNVWALLGDTPLPRITFPAAFRVGPRGYFAFGRVNTSVNELSARVFEVDLSVFPHAWRRLKDAPVSAHERVSGTAVGDAGYVVFGDGRLARYAPADDSWTPLAPLPTGSVAGTLWTHLVALDGVLYVGWSNERTPQGGQASNVFAYTIATDTWRKLPDFPLPPYWWTHGFAWGGRVYFGGGVQQEGLPEQAATSATFSPYNPATNTWEGNGPSTGGNFVVAAWSDGPNAFMALNKSQTLFVYEGGPSFRQLTLNPEMTCPLREVAPSFGSAGFVYEGRPYALGGKDALTTQAPFMMWWK